MSCEITRPVKTHVQIFTNLQSPPIYHTALGQVWAIKDKGLHETSNLSTSPTPLEGFRIPHDSACLTLSFWSASLSRSLLLFLSMDPHVEEEKNKELKTKNTSLTMFSKRWEQLAFPYSSC